MAIQFADMVQETTTTTGTGDTVTLTGATLGHQTFADGIGADAQVFIKIESGNDWEIYLADYSFSAGTVNRAAGYLSSSLNGVGNFSIGAGAKVSLVIPTGWIDSVENRLPTGISHIAGTYGAVNATADSENGITMVQSTSDTPVELWATPFDSGALIRKCLILAVQIGGTGTVGAMKAWELTHAAVNYSSVFNSGFSSNVLFQDASATAWDIFEQGTSGSNITVQGFGQTGKTILWITSVTGHRLALA